MKPSENYHAVDDGARLLDVSQLTKRFGGVIAVNKLDLSVDTDDIVGLIGPNGSGKSTCFNLITGVNRPTTGHIRYRGRDITNWPSYRIAELGVGRTFQNPRIFANSTALENVLVGGHLKAKTGILSVLLCGRDFRKKEKAIRELAIAQLEFVGLADSSNARARHLPYGAVKRLEIARALAMGPRILIMDEPAGGLNPRETLDLVGLIGKIRGAGTTILIIEHNMRLIMDICRRIIVIDAGTKIAEGSPKEIQQNQRVQEAYLGRAAHDARL